MSFKRLPRRKAAGDCFVQVGLLYGELSTFEDYLRAAHRVIRIAGDAVYCAASLETVRRLAAEGIPVVGHVGLIPVQGDLDRGLQGSRQACRDGDAGLQAGQGSGRGRGNRPGIEVVPDRVTAEIAKRTSLVLLSMGAGTAGDAQYLFAQDVLGYTRGHRPRHAKVYRDFRAEYDRLQGERIAAFREFAADVGSGAYPAAEHLVPIPDDEFDAFVQRLPP